MNKDYTPMDVKSPRCKTCIYFSYAIHHRCSCTHPDYQSRGRFWYIKGTGIACEKYEKKKKKKIKDE